MKLSTTKITLTNCKPDKTLALVGGTLGPSNVASGAYSGVELDFNCLRGANNSLVQARIGINF